MFMEFLALLLLVVVIGIPVYKYRVQFKRWIKDPRYGDLRTWEPDKITCAKRGLIKAQWKVEDAQEYLAYLEAEPKTETGES